MWKDNENFHVFNVIERGLISQLWNTRKPWSLDQTLLIYKGILLLFHGKMKGDQLSGNKENSSNESYEV